MYWLGLQVWGYHGFVEIFHSYVALLNNYKESDMEAMTSSIHGKWSSVYRLDPTWDHAFARMICITSGILPLVATWMPSVKKCSCQHGLSCLMISSSTYRCANFLLLVSTHAGQRRFAHTDVRFPDFGGYKKSEKSRQTEDGRVAGKMFSYMVVGGVYSICIL